MRRTTICTIFCAAATAVSALALFLPIHTPRGENCGSAYVAASPPHNDDSWYSTCANLRDQRRGDFTLPLVLAGAGLLISATLTARRYRERELGFVA
jgi:hypothetical protein